MSLNLWRQFDIIPEEKLKTPIIVIGAGGVGSILVLLLAKMGMEDITVYDPDTIEDHNIPNQMFPFEKLGLNKAEAMGEIGFEWAETKIISVADKYDGAIAPIIVSGVDSMEARKEIWGMIKMNAGVKMYIDCRMGAEFLTIYTVKPFLSDDITYYENKLFDDEKTVQEPCTNKAIIYNTAFIGSIAASRIKNYLVGDEQKNPKEIIADITTLQMLTN
jgi:molybdopterin/thiamine biosynthesis adenylyltransferase